MLGRTTVVMPESGRVNLLDGHSPLSRRPSQTFPLASDLTEKGL